MRLTPSSSLLFPSPFLVWAAWLKGWASWLMGCLAWMISRRPTSTMCGRAMTMWAGETRVPPMVTSRSCLSLTASGILLLWRSVELGMEAKIMIEGKGMLGRTWGWCQQNRIQIHILLLTSCRHFMSHFISRVFSSFVNKGVGLGHCFSMYFVAVVSSTELTYSLCKLGAPSGTHDTLSPQKWFNVFYCQNKRNEL